MTERGVEVAAPYARNDKGSGRLHPKGTSADFVLGRHGRKPDVGIPVLSRRLPRLAEQASQ